MPNKILPVTNVKEKLELAFHSAYRSPWFRCREIVPWLEKITVVLNEYAHLTEEKFIQAVRNYVYTAKGTANSFIRRDDFDFPMKSLDGILRDIYSYHADLTPKPARIMCQSSMLAMGCLLGIYGIFSREVAILRTCLDPEGPMLRSHALLEVWNSEMRRWELHDPTLDLEYGLKHPLQPKHASALELFSKPHEEQAFIVADEKFVSKEGPFSWQKRLEGYHRYSSFFFDIIAYNYLSYNACVHINLDKADLSSRFSQYGNGNLIEILNRLYRGGCITPPLIHGWSNGNQVMFPPEREFDSEAWRSGSEGS